MKTDAKKISEALNKKTGPKAKFNSKEAEADSEDITSALNKKLSRRN
jgi:hypothetical protein